MCTKPRVHRQTTSITTIHQLETFLETSSLFLRKPCSSEGTVLSESSLITTKWLELDQQSCECLANGLRAQKQELWILGFEDNMLAGSEPR
jgi:hypothetical protein